LIATDGRCTDRVGATDGPANCAPAWSTAVKPGACGAPLRGCGALLRRLQPKAWQRCLRRLFLAQPADEPSAARAEKVALPAISMAAAGATNAGAVAAGDISTLHVG